MYKESKQLVVKSLQSNLVAELSTAFSLYNQHLAEGRIYMLCCHCYITAVPIIKAKNIFSFVIAIILGGIILTWEDRVMHWSLEIRLVLWMYYFTPLIKHSHDNSIDDVFWKATITVKCSVDLWQRKDWLLGCFFFFFFFFFCQEWCS